MKLTEAQHRNLLWLVDNGGVAFIDKHGRLVAGGQTASQGSWISWLHLISNGLMSGGERRLSVTDYGRQHVKPTRPITAQPSSAAEMDAMLHDQLGDD
jgi:hypothetical protein